MVPRSELKSQAMKKHLIAAMMLGAFALVSTPNLEAHAPDPSIDLIDQPREAIDFEITTEDAEDFTSFHSITIDFVEMSHPSPFLILTRDREPESSSNPAGITEQAAEFRNRIDQPDPYMNTDLFVMLIHERNAGRTPFAHLTDIDRLPLSWSLE